MASNEKMPLEKDYIYTDKLAWWTASLQPCEISESELDNVKNYLCHNTKFEDFNPHEQIEVTNIVRLEEIKTITKSGTITDHQLFFKQPKQVEEIEDVKLQFFKEFGSQSFRGYPLEQCHSIWEFFKPHLTRNI